MSKRKFLTVFIICSLMVIQPAPVQSQEFTPVKNIILMVGDGMGLEQLKLGSLIEHGNETGLFIQQPQFLQGNMTTHSADELITDSAASATAMSTGWKVENGLIAQLSNGTTVETFLEYSQNMGLKTGLVSTTTFYHATPASFAAHESSRYNYAEIIEEMLITNPDLMFGGANDFELARLDTDFNTLVADNGYTLIGNKSDLNSLDSNKTLGVFNYDGHIPYEADINPDTDIRLRDLTMSALGKLDSLAGDEGFFLMVEGGRIDHGGHENNLTRQALEMIEFDHTIELVYEWVQSNPNTIVIVTGDHETGGLIIDSSEMLDTSLPTDETTEIAKQQRRIDRVGQLEAHFTSTYHTSVNIPIFAFGSSVDDIFTESDSEIYDNTDIYRLLRSAIDGEKFTEVFNDISLPGSQEPPSNPSSEEMPTPQSSDEANLYFSFTIIALVIVQVMNRRVR